jgi:hypothetical protein
MVDPDFTGLDPDRDVAANHQLRDGLELPFRQLVRADDNAARAGAAAVQARTAVAGAEPG